MTQDNEYEESIVAYKAKIARWNTLVEQCRPQGEELGHSYLQVAGMIAEKEGWYDADIDAYADTQKRTDLYTDLAKKFTKEDKA